MNHEPTAFVSVNPIHISAASMGLRDYFAAKAMQAFFTEHTRIWTDDVVEDVVKTSYKAADAMLIKRAA